MHIIIEIKFIEHSVNKIFVHFIIIPLGRGRGRGRGRGKPESKEWQPVTKLGRLVKDGKIKTIEEIYNFSLAIKVNI